MTSNAKRGLDSPLSSQADQTGPDKAEAPWGYYEALDGVEAARGHDPDAKALLNRYLEALQTSRQTFGNATRQELESKLAALCGQPEPGETAPPQQTSLEKDADRSADANAPASDVKPANLNDRLAELSTYLDEDIAAARKSGAIKTVPHLVAGPERAGKAETEQKPFGKTVNAPILDRAWFETRFATMRSAIDDVAQTLPDRRIDALSEQFGLLMEKLDAIEADRSREAVESGLKKLAAYLEENKHWSVAQDGRMTALEERLDHLGRLVAQSNAALSATAKGLELVARRTGPEMASRTADLVAGKIDEKLQALDSGGKVEKLSTEVSKLSEASQTFARKTDQRLKLLQNSLDDGLQRFEEIGNTKIEADTLAQWDGQSEHDMLEEELSGQLAAARRAAKFGTSDAYGLPEESEPIRHRIPYGEFLPPEERGTSHTGLIIAAVILLLASAAMLYLNLRENGTAKLFSGAAMNQPVAQVKQNAALAPIRIVLSDKHASAADRAASPQARKVLLVDRPDSRNEPLHRSAISGDIEAQFGIAEAYLRNTQGKSGDDVEQTLIKAARWFRRAADGGHISAQYRLAALYELGHGVRQDYRSAMSWYERAARGGHTKAMHNLGVLLIGDPEQPNAYETAAAWFSKAASLGLRDSQYNLAILYEHGLGVRQDERRAYRWYAEAALQGDEKAANRRDALSRRLPAQERTALLPRPKPRQWAAVTTNSANRSNGFGDNPTPASIPVSTAAHIAREKTIPASWTPQLSQFDGDVVQAQRLLQQLGYRLGEADGILGPKTAAAIRSYQRKAGLAQTGTVSPTLIANMKAAISL